MPTEPVYGRTCGDVDRQKHGGIGLRPHVEARQRRLVRLLQVRICIATCGHADGTVCMRLHTSGCLQNASPRQFFTHCPGATATRAALEWSVGAGALLLWRATRAAHQAVGAGVHRVRGRLEGPDVGQLRQRAVVGVLLLYPATPRILQSSLRSSARAQARALTLISCLTMCPFSVT